MGTSDYTKEDIKRTVYDAIKESVKSQMIRDNVVIPKPAKTIYVEQGKRMRKCSKCDCELHPTEFHVHIRTASSPAFMVNICERCLSNLLVETKIKSGRSSK